MKYFFQPMLTILLLCMSPLLYADELIVNAGGGKQYGASQHNRTFGLDYSFYRKVRSHRQHLLLGLSLTRMSANTPGSGSILAISLYPQLNLYPKRQSWGQPFFFVRALGPSYISSNKLGTRNQKNHFAFQAQVGVGAYLNYQEKRDGIVMLSFKHFSNAGIFNVNEGFNLPVVLSVGVKF
mgnify:CR=1 FL=1